MPDQTVVSDRLTQENWLKGYYFTRAGFAFLWILAVLTVGQRSPGASAILLVCYPAWDSLANLIDANRHGGLTRNPSQFFNAVASGLVAVALAVALPDMNRVLAVFGAWAIASGLLQLATGVRRWKLHGAQWAMVLSGAQSALAGGFFIFQAQLPAVPTVASLAGYAGFGGFYFLVSAVLLSATAYRRRRAQ